MTKQRIAITALPPGPFVEPWDRGDGSFHLGMQPIRWMTRAEMEAIYPNQQPNLQVATPVTATDGAGHVSVAGLNANPQKSSNDGV